MNSEVERIREVYRQRKEKGISWSVFSPEVHFLNIELQRKFLRAFKLIGINEKSVGFKKLLDAGCGSGRWLKWFQDLGFKDLSGVDILDEEIINAKGNNPNISFNLASISSLPFSDNYFDIVVLSEVLSLILDEKTRKDSARELLRVTAAGGAIILNDTRKFLFWEPKIKRKPYLRPIKKNDLINLFPEAEINLSSFMVDPFLTGMLTSVINRGILNSLLRKTPVLRRRIKDKQVLMLQYPYCLVEIIKYLGFLNTHIFAIIRKPK